MQSLLESKELFDVAVAQGKIMIVRRDHSFERRDGMTTGDAPQRSKFKHAFQWMLTACFTLYFIGAGVSLLYYNYAFAHEHGFVRWLLLGEFVPTGKALAWPYFVYSDHNASVEKQQKIAYWKAIGALQAPEFNYDEFAGRVEERMSAAGEEAGQEMLAVGLENQLNGIKASVAAFERITPPQCYITLHADQLRVLHDYIPVLDEWLASLRSHNKIAIMAASQKEEGHRQEVAKLTKRILDELVDLGLAARSADQ
jgi:hypothetical protein